MFTVDATAAPRHPWRRHLRGHLLLFDRTPAPTVTAHAGARLLLVAGLLEIVRLAALRWLYPGIQPWLLLPALLLLGVLAVPGIARVQLAQLGFRPWRDWSATEKSYFLQVVLVAAVVLPMVLAAPVRAAASGIGRGLLAVFLPYLCFGFYQELVYRGMVQPELVRRWGAALGIIAANALYTFGPLHWYYFASRGALAWPMFASIFAIGLFFGVLYRRSGNLWIVTVFHAIGNAYIGWSVGAVR